MPDLRERFRALDETRWPDLWPSIEARAEQPTLRALPRMRSRLALRRLVPAAAAVVAGLIVAITVLVPRPPSALAIVNEARADFEHVPPFHAIIVGHVPAELVARDTGGKVSTEAVYRWELWYQSGDSWRLTLLENSVPSNNPGPSGGFLLLAGEFFYRYEAASNSFVARQVGGRGTPASRFASPLGVLGWDETGDKLAECEDSGERLEVLPDEEVGGRTARHIRCGSLFEVWIDAETGLLLRLVQPQILARSGPEPEAYEPGPLGAVTLTPGDRVEVASVEYDPFFPPGTLEFVPPEGAREVPFPEASPPSPAPGTVLGTKLVVGEVAPLWTGPLLGGGTLDLRELRGRPALVLFWMDSTACPDSICGVALRQFQRAFDGQRDRLNFASVVRLGRPDVVEAEVVEGGYTFPVVLDPSEEVSSRWGIVGVPTFVLLDDQRRVVEVRQGVITDEDFQAFLAQAER